MTLPQRLRSMHLADFIGVWAAVAITRADPIAKRWRDFRNCCATSCRSIFADGRAGQPVAEEHIEASAPAWGTTTILRQRR